jgi:hypothetical protein
MNQENFKRLSVCSYLLIRFCSRVEGTLTSSLGLVILLLSGISSLVCIGLTGRLGLIVGSRSLIGIILSGRLGLVIGSLSGRGSLVVRVLSSRGSLVCITLSRLVGRVDIGLDSLSGGISFYLGGIRRFSSRLVEVCTTSGNSIASSAEVLCSSVEGSCSCALQGVDDTRGIWISRGDSLTGSRDISLQQMRQSMDPFGLAIR